MRLRTKILLLAILPLLAALALIAFAVQYQERRLAEREHAMVERAYLDARREELRNYVALAASTISPLYARGGNEAVDREQALRLLASLDYGRDGYFFVYDLEGRVLMHSRQPELVGQNLWELRDPQGRFTIQRLIAQARAGGGFVDYPWRKPSTGELAPKLGYVIAYERWGWMIGTGLYTDGIRATLGALSREANRNIATTLLGIAGIAALGLAAVSIGALALNLSEHRVAESKLRLLARQVQASQEEERTRLARELHDGVSQTLVSTKLLVETGQASGAAEPLSRALERLESCLDEVRRISHRLRPALLDTLGLPAALQHLAGEIEEVAGLQVELQIEGEERELLPELKTAMFRVAQEALTNAVKHARAAHIELLLGFEDQGLRLQIRDDGVGFDERAVALHPEQGIGLRNMRERLAALGGRLQIIAQPGAGTVIAASLPTT
jgi:two-component system NarL family sensor kinase